MWKEYIVSWADSVHPVMKNTMKENRNCNEIDFILSLQLSNRGQNDYS